MAKASLTLPSGVAVTIEGTPKEVHELLRLHGGAGMSPAVEPSRRVKRDLPAVGEKDLVPKIVNLVRSCNEAELIEKQILDKRSLPERCLLPMYIVHAHLTDGGALTSGQIAAVTRELGIPVSQANVAHTLSGAAARYVMIGGIRKSGVAVPYRINRRGILHLKATLQKSGS